MEQVRLEIADIQDYSNEFRKNASVDRKDFAAIEYLLRKGQRQLDIYSNPGIKDIEWGDEAGMGPSKAFNIYLLEGQVLTLRRPHFLRRALGLQSFSQSISIASEHVSDQHSTYEDPPQNTTKRVSERYGIQII